MSIVKGLNIEGAFAQVQRKITFQYRDPLLPPYGVDEKITSTQRKGWAFLKRYTGLGPMIAMIAAKGAAKTHFGACFAWHQAQQFPGSIGCLVSNTFGQAKDNGLPIFLKVGAALGYEAEFFEKRKIRGRAYTNVVVISLAEDVYSFMLLRSYDAIKNFEGVEIDWLWSEEGQDATFEEFQVPMSRNRGQYGDNAVFYAAMPEMGSHWQYKRLPELGMVEEKLWVEPDIEEVRSSRSNDNDDIPLEIGIMYEFSVFENKKNVGAQYIQRNSMIYTGVLYDLYVSGIRGASSGNRLFPNYNYELHTNGFMPRFLQGMDYSRDAYLILDFNVSPMCATVWQKKDWNDLWMDSCYFEDGKLMRVVDTEDGSAAEEVSDVTLVAPPNREVYVQVGEIECWSGGTRGAMEMFCDKYEGFRGQLFVNGDATGNSERSSSTTTDWKIVSDYLTNAGFNFSLQPGLVPSYPKNFNGGEITYNNPPRKDTFNITNLLLRDQTGRVHIVFMPESEYESGGAANSVGSMETNPDGVWNESCDKKEGRDVPRTHFTDTVRYFAWLVTGGNILSLAPESELSVADILAERQKARAKTQLGLKRGKLTNHPNRPKPSVVSGGRKRTGSLLF